METVVRNVSDIDAADRRALEHVVGSPLGDHQQVVISVVNPEATASPVKQSRSPAAVAAMSRSSKRSAGTP